MTELLRDVETPSDAELISRVRGGDVTAYGELFSRHKTAANRLARQLVRGLDSDDLVAEAFAKVLTVLRGGGGPDVAFRAYLLTAVRRLHIDRVRSGQRLQTTDDMTPFDPGVPFKDTAVAGFERGAAAKAFASLPERWQLVLWHLEVEGQKPADIAPLLGMSPNSVSALAYRAREGLRQAFLTMHLSDTSATDCRWVNEHLGAFVRKGLSKRDAVKVQKHLDGCRRCTAMYLELNDVNSNLAGIIAPLLLGAAAAGYVASTGAGSVGVVAALSRAKDVVVANSGAAAAAGVASAVAAAAVIAVVVTQGGDPSRTVVADPPPAATSSAPTSPGSSPSALGSASASPSLKVPAPTSRTGATASVPPTTAPVPPTPTFSVSPVPVPPVAPATSPVLSPTSLAASPTASAEPSPSISPTPSASPSASPPPTDRPSPVPTPDRFVGTPVLHADGTVTVVVRNVRSTDTVDVTIRSQDTTFRGGPGAGSGLAVAGCLAVGSRHAVCRPGASADRASPPSVTSSSVSRVATRLAVTLPLAFPDAMVSDDVEVTASVRGVLDASATTGRQAFRPERTPVFDSVAPVLGAPVHTLVGAEDRYDLTTTAVLPPRVTGLLYTISAPAHFRAGAADGCTVVAAGSELRCADVKGGERVTLPVATEGLATSARVDIRVSPVDHFVDPEPGNDTASLALRPGADLGLTLALVSANPDRDALVTLSGRLSGLRRGQSSVVYRLSSGAAFPGVRTTGTHEANPGCALLDDGRLTCQARPGGDVTLTVASSQRGVATPITVTVVPAPPFEPVGQGTHAAALTLPSRPAFDFAFSPTTLEETAHTIVADNDSYTLTGRVGPPPSDIQQLAFRTGAGTTFATVQPNPHCFVSSSPMTGGQLLCSGLTGAELSLEVETTAPGAQKAAVELLASEPYDDPDLGNNTATSGELLPGTSLTVAPHDLGDLHQTADGTYPVSLHVSGIRAGVGAVTLGLSEGLHVATVAPGTPCRAIDVDAAGSLVTRGALLCDRLPDGATVTFTLRSADPASAAHLRLVVSPGSSFVNVGEQNTVSASLVPSYDFGLTDLAETAHSVSGNIDTFSLTADVAAVPLGAAAVSFEVTRGGAFADPQAPGCVVADERLSCPRSVLAQDITFRLASTSIQTHGAEIRLLVPDGYDDPDRDNNAAEVIGLRPGVDLHLTDVDPDNESPDNVDDRHLVVARLSGVRPGLGSVTYALTGRATFGAAGGACTGEGTRTLTCQDPTDGPVTFYLTSEKSSSRETTRITIAASAPDPYVELSPADNTGSTTLTARPTYNFGLGPLTLDAHSVIDGTDLLTVSSRVQAPDGVGPLTFGLDEGGTFAEHQAGSCERLDATRTACTPGAGGAVELRVSSTSVTRHVLKVTLEVPTGYRDPSLQNNDDSIDVTPAVDLHLGPLTPSDPVPDTGLYEVSSVLTGLRGGPVTFELTGNATFSATSCSGTDTKVTEVTCASPTNGERVRFILAPTAAKSSTAVRIQARSTGFDELIPWDDAQTTTLAPDVTISALFQRPGTHRLYAVVRAQVTGVPTGVSAVRLHLTGADVGLTALRFISGADGADGEGPVDCFTSSENGKALTEGVYATCTGVGLDKDGSFYVDMRVARLPLEGSVVTLTVIPVGADEGAHGTNNSRGVTLHLMMEALV